MKKIMIWATLLVSVCACQNNPTGDEQPMPSTFIELFEGIASMRGDVNVTISSSDSATTSFYYEWFGYYEDYGVPAIEMDTTLMNESKTNDSVAALVAEREAIEDSVAQTKRTIREYVEKGILHLVNKYRPQAAKYYRFESHQNGRDSIEFVLAPQELTDSLPEDLDEKNFKDTYAYYPEFFHYYYNGGKAQNLTSICYHREERKANKKAASKSKATSKSKGTSNPIPERSDTHPTSPKGAGPLPFPEGETSSSEIGRGISAVADLVGQPCPVCGKGHIIKGKTAYGCSEWKAGCTFRRPFGPQTPTPTDEN